LRLILAAVKDKDISSRSIGNFTGINETEIISLLQNMIKQRNASIEMYIQGKRDDLIKIEEDEIEIISNFLPEQLSENEMNDIITNTIKSSGANSIKDMGKVINLIKDEYNGKMDFGAVSKVIKEKLLKL
ncbi:GatB/YqeY domain-containing protein, partial [Alphaproteobacteria bacterium]|nr:GatB/YqeY domain-containing protein [Alphaproteobacteria bacterium]